MWSSDRCNRDGRGRAEPGMPALVSAAAAGPQLDARRLDARRLAVIDIALRVIEQELTCQLASNKKAWAERVKTAIVGASAVALARQRDQLH
ncbi:hypothetical protein HXX76_003278 [Chlamydomonas incerta]|uniref:Uncharacterized protein n=1 Tax=Chlamydomonas incerta TaxID=51695 RepID=A0A835TMK9_CHLIN|nr:hypothetical protein HXX76_003278 [Chlamydomonas incerta]|eukprot:KAG2441660.1 hypothetical protein HXX76_003278 [Chlamydomonas incerta]